MAISAHYLVQLRRGSYIHGKSSVVLLKIEKHKSLAQRIFPRLRYIGHCPKIKFQCLSQRLLITSGVMWQDMDPIRLVKQARQLLYGNYRIAQL